MGWKIKPSKRLGVQFRNIEWTNSSAFYELRPFIKMTRGNIFTALTDSKDRQRYNDLSFLKYKKKLKKLTDVQEFKALKDKAQTEEREKIYRLKDLKTDLVQKLESYGYKDPLPTLGAPLRRVRNNLKSFKPQSNATIRSVLPSITPKKTKTLMAFIRDIEELEREIVAAHIPALIIIAKNFQSWPGSLADLINFGMEGYYQALDLFNPDHKAKARFLTYGFECAIQKMGRGTIYAHNHMGAYQNQQLRDIEQAEESLMKSLERMPHDEEIADFLGYKGGKWQGEWLSAEQRVTRIRANITRRDAACGGYGSKLSHLFEEEAQHYIDDENYHHPTELSELKDDIEQLLLELQKGEALGHDERQRDIVELRYGLTGSDPLTFQEIAEHYGVTRERIRQIEVLALRRMQQPSRSRMLVGHLDDNPYDLD